MGSLRLAAIALILGSAVLVSPVLVSSALAQSAPTYGLGRTPSAEEIRARDINIGPTGEELPRATAPPRKAQRSSSFRGVSSAMAQRPQGDWDPG